MRAKFGMVGPAVWPPILDRPTRTQHLYYRYRFICVLFFTFDIILFVFSQFSLLILHVPCMIIISTIFCKAVSTRNKTVLHLKKLFNYHFFFNFNFDDFLNSCIE